MSRSVLISLISVLVLVLVVGGVIVGSDQSAWSVHELIITDHNCHPRQRSTNRVG
jgi:hypothetical protein